MSGAKECVAPLKEKRAKVYKMTRPNTIDTWLEWILFAVAVYVATLVLSRAVANQSAIVAGIIYVLVGWGIYVLAHPVLVEGGKNIDIDIGIGRRVLSEALRFAALPLASVYVVFFLFVLYVSLILVGVPLGADKPWVVRGVEWLAFSLFLVSMIELGTDVLFRASIVDPVRDWINGKKSDTETETTTDKKQEPADKETADADKESEDKVETNLEDKETAYKESEDKESFLSRPRPKAASFRPRGYTFDKPYRATLV